MTNNQEFKIHFKWIGSATWVLNINEVKIACDPVLCPKGTVQTYAPGFRSKRLTDPVFDTDDFQNIDIWLISHEHEDHLDTHGLSKIDEKSIIIANKKSKKILQTIHPENLHIVRYPQTLSFTIKGMTVEIQVMPAVHASNPLTAFFLGGGNGYWLTIKKDDAECNIYVTGDTVSHKKVLDAIAGHEADILIPNIGAPFRNAFGGPFTFTTKTLQPVIDAVKPDVILPVHFGSFSHFHESHSIIKSWADDRMKIFTEGDCYKN